MLKDNEELEWAYLEDQLHKHKATDTINSEDQANDSVNELVDSFQFYTTLQLKTKFQSLLSQQVLVFDYDWDSENESQIFYLQRKKNNDHLSTQQ